MTQQQLGSHRDGRGEVMRQVNFRAGAMDRRCGALSVATCATHICRYLKEIVV